MPKVNGRDIIVAIDLSGGVTYKTVVCLTSNTITNSVTELDGSGKCGNEFVPGVKFDASIDGEGFLVDPDTGAPTNIGFPELYSAFVNRLVVGIKFGKATPTTGEAVYSGTAFITSLEQVAADDELVTFTVTMKCAAPPFTQTITY
jgi:predicted secreted protein